MNRKSTITFVLGLQLFAAGCASYNYTDAPPQLGLLYSKYVYIGYTGELKPIEDVGVVTTDGLVQLYSVDGVPVQSLTTYKSSGLYSGGRVQLHLSSGSHSLSLGYHDDRGGGTVSWSTSSITKVVTIKKGQVIHLTAAVNGRNWSVVEHDGSKAIAVIVNDFKDLTKTK